jgi:hypothetical protein
MRHFLIVALLIMVLPGCDFFSKSHPKMSEVWPVYRVPEQPKLNIPETIVPGKNPEVDAMTRNLYNTISYADSLKIIVETHNQAAKAHNRDVEAQLGINQPGK